MKLRPITSSDIDTAAALLAEGFPAHSRQIWTESLQHLFALAQQEGNGSVGHVASAGGQDIGICLSVPGKRFAFEPAPRKVVNLAAFYLRPGNEWMTTLFMRRIVKDPSVEYIDLTASESMRQVLRRLGFTDRTHGMVVVPTMTAALLPARSARVMTLSQVPVGRISEDHLSLLDWHADRGAISLVVEAAGTYYPLILARGRYKRLASARVLLACDRELLCAIAGALARHLLGRGIAFFEFDSPSPMPIAGSRFVAGASPVQSTWPTESAAIDHTFSELVLVPQHRAFPLLPPWIRGRTSAVPLPAGLMDHAITTAIALLTISGANDVLLS